MLSQLAYSTEEYVKSTINEYGDAIPERVRKYIPGVKDYRDILRIDDSKTVSFRYSEGKIYIPQKAIKILKIMRFVPGFGIKKNHKCYEGDSLTSETTYFGYVMHMYLAGLSPEQFCNETLPHEVIHLCGSRGGEPFLEGLTELKAREVSAKYGFSLSRCGYNKEVDIVIQVQEILGKDLMTRIAFEDNEIKLRDLIVKEYGERTYQLFEEIRDYMRDMSKYSARIEGRFSSIRKVIEYSKVEYPDIDVLISNLESVSKKERFKSNISKDKQYVGQLNEQVHGSFNNQEKKSRFNLDKVDTER